MTDQEFLGLSLTETPSLFLVRHLHYRSLAREDPMRLIPERSHSSFDPTPPSPSNAY